MNKNIIIVFGILSEVLIAQNIKVRYKNRVSPIAYFNEDLIITGKKVVGVRDSIVYKNAINDAMANEDSNSVTIPIKETLYKIKYYKNLNKKPILYTEYIKDIKYCINDKLPLIDWKIDETKSKTISKYRCFEAKGVFRGSNITAYFTKDLPYSTGPFKFEGLPGLILEVKQDGVDYNSWVATSITNAVSKAIKLENIKTQISLKDFVVLQENQADDYFNQQTKNLPKNVKITRMKVPRQGVEKIYEWE